MLRALRWKLTILYFVIAIGLVGLVGVGTYFLIDRYFQQTIDLALRYKMATQFQALGLKLPDELKRAEKTWLQNNNQPVRLSPTAVSSKESDNDDDDDDDDEKRKDSANGYSYNADLAAIFVVSLDQAATLFSEQVQISPL